MFYKCFAKFYLQSKSNGKSNNLAQHILASSLKIIDKKRSSRLKLRSIIIRLVRDTDSFASKRKMQENGK